MLEANQKFAGVVRQGRDLDRSVHDDVDRIRSLSQIPGDATVSGHVYDVRTRTLREVVPAE